MTDIIVIGMVAIGFPLSTVLFLDIFIKEKLGLRPSLQRVLREW